MGKSGIFLFVSNNPELQQVLETLRSAYGFSLLTAENLKEGLNFIHITEPDCIIVDLGLLGNNNHVGRLKDKVRSSGKPVLFLNENGNGKQRPKGPRSSVSVEPIVKFVAEHSRRLKANSSGRSWYRFFRRSKAQKV